MARTTKREIFIGVAAGLVLLGLVALGIYAMSRRTSSNRIQGKIISKDFSPQPETQITIGKRGVRTSTLDGDYTLKVHVDSENRTYNVWVDKDTYSRHQIGELFSFLRPPSEQH